MAGNREGRRGEIYLNKKEKEKKRKKKERNGEI